MPEWLLTLLSATAVSAVVSGVMNLVLDRRKNRAEERIRTRNAFAEAFRAYADYKEFPYAVRRRDAARPAEERQRLSDELRAVQSQLAYFVSWTMLESPAVGSAYNNMVNELRRIAGSAIHDAWESPGISDDAAMNIPRDVIDLTPLAPLEKTYRTAVAAHLHQLGHRN